MRKEKQLKWTSIDIQEVIDSDFRLDANIYGIEGRQARQDLAKCRWDIVPLNDLFRKDAFYLGRFKRIYIEKMNGMPFLLPSQMTDLYPKATKFLSHATNIDIGSTKVKKAQVLLTRSGSIGVVSYVSKTLENQSLSDDVIRIEAKKYSGYIYAYLKSRIGRLLVQTNNYGAVVKHIEPEHLQGVPIPDPPSDIKREIHNLIEESFKLRDESNELLDAAQVLLKEALELPSIEVLHEQAKQFDETAGVINFSVPSSEVLDRLDGSYYVPVVGEIEQHLANTAKEVVRIGDSRISKSIVLPGRFKRIYVEEGSGVLFIGGKQLYELYPSTKKYLSISKHTKKIKNELTIKEGMLLITRAGTPGNTVLAPRHWDGWAITDNIISLIPTSNGIGGYLYAWLSSEYGQELIHRFVCGSVVSYLETEHILRISVPLLNDQDTQQEINDMVLEANQKRTKAYNLEQEALKVLDEKVIYAR